MTSTTTTPARHLEMPIPGYACKANYYITNRLGTTKVTEVTCRFCLQVQINKFASNEADGFGGPQTRKSIAEYQKALASLSFR